MSYGPADWQGTRPCAGKNGDTRCREPEIEGLEFCFRHVPDDLLAEAEMVTGMRQCWRAKCREPAIDGDRGCDNHAAAKKVIEGRVMGRLQEILELGGESLLDPPPIGNPFDELLGVAAEMKALQVKLRSMVVGMDAATWRYATSRAGEMVRAEITLYERALERYAAILINITKLGIEARLSAITNEQARKMRTALDAAFSDAAIPLEDQAKARESFVRHLRAAG